MLSILKKIVNAALNIFAVNMIDYGANKVRLLKLKMITHKSGYIKYIIYIKYAKNKKDILKLIKMLKTN